MSAFSASTFAALVLLAVSAVASDTVLVEFHSANCGPCRAMQPVVQRLAAEGYPLQQIDVDQQRQYVEQFQIRSLPTFILFARGREVQRAEGSTSQVELAAMFQKVGYSPPIAAAKTESATQFTSAPAAPQGHHQATQGQLQATQGYVSNVAQTATVSPQQRAGFATVRLKIEDDRGFSFGTGTIIDRHDEEALVLTCGHIFRQSQGKGKVTVDLFAPGATQPIAGQVIAYDLERDIALVSIRPGLRIDPVPIAPDGYAVQPRDRVFTIGCDKGAVPSVRTSLITAVNKYQGSPNYTADGAPVEGRSGGGLFTETGLLIGVCNAADEPGNEGLYAALASVHWQLDQIGQSAIYKKTSPAQNIGPSNIPPSNIAVSTPAAPPLMPAVMPASFTSPTSAPRANAAPSLTTNPVAAAQVVPADDTEVIVIVRSRSNPGKQSEIFVMDRPPAEIIRQLQSSGHAAPRGGSQDLLRSASQLGQQSDFGRTDGAPIVRGQSQ